VLHLKDLYLHQNCAHFAKGGWAQARTSYNCTQKLLYHRNMGSSREISFEEFCFAIEIASV